MVSDRLKKVILAELGLADWELADGTVAAQVPGWDSLSHARIISAVEDAYGIRFRTGEIVRLKNVGQLQALVDGKAGAPRGP
jgi:acyl carrier protein